MKNVDNVVCMVYYMGKLYNKSVKAKNNPVLLQPYTTTTTALYTQLHNYKITCEKN
jgi:hypothetical protein